MINPALQKNRLDGEHTDETSVRPLRLDDFIGQAGVKDNLRVFIHAAKNRGDAMDHVLLFGPPRPGQNHLGANHC